MNAMLQMNLIGEICPMFFSKIVIYGAGDFGQRLYHFLCSLGVSVDCFCQTEAESGKCIERLPLISTQELYAMQGNLLIFLAIGNAEVSQQIRLHLNSIFLDCATVIECARFIGMNDIGNDCPRKGYCVLCNSRVDAFSPGGVAGIENVQLFKEHHIIGGGWRENYACPRCGGVDRERWQLWVLSRYTGIFREKCCVLHFAPEPHLSKYIAANLKCEYYTGDIVRGRAMHYTDILDIQYKDKTFDYVIMNHVLEHITDVKKAMAEVKRVLKQNGKLVLSFPICTDMDTLELPDVMTEEERLEHYGQKDHVRLFGRDYLERVKAFGFEVSVYTPKKCCTQEEVDRYGFIEDDILMICEKRKEDVIKA